jgi:glucan biosynthesis protein
MLRSERDDGSLDRLNFEYISTMNRRAKLVCRSTYKSSVTAAPLRVVTTRQQHFQTLAFAQQRTWMRKKKQNFPLRLNNNARVLVRFE